MERSDFTPAIYAHHRLGDEVFKRLSGRAGQAIQAHREAFTLGLQGPDLLFFYRPLKKNPVSDYGNRLHAQPARLFFEPGVEAVRHLGEGGAAHAYLLGAVCHFALDSLCHPYVEEQVRCTGVTHMEIEEELEKALLRQDGQDALGYPMAKLVPVRRENAQAAAPFYPEVPEKAVWEALRTMRAVKRLFTARGACKRGVLMAGMRALGLQEKWKGLVHQSVDNPLCTQSNRELLKRWTAAPETALRLIASLQARLETGSALDSWFERSFD